MDELCVITSERSGAGHLLQLATNFQALAARPELFSRGRPVSQPIALLDAARDEARGQGKRVLGFRLVRDQVPLEMIEAELLTRPNLRVLIVLRRPIDAYISLRKAVELGKWAGVDTTAIMVRLDADQFEAWLAAETGWYRSWQMLLARRGLPMPILRYETHVDQPPDAVLRRLAIAAAQLGITLKPPSEIADPGRKRQDLSKVVADKVKDWPGFSREMFRRGLEGPAFAYPL